MCRSLAKRKRSDTRSPSLPRTGPYPPEALTPPKRKYSGLPSSGRRVLNPERGRGVVPQQCTTEGRENEGSAAVHGNRLSGRRRRCRISDPPQPSPARGGPVVAGTICCRSPLRLGSGAGNQCRPQPGQRRRRLIATRAGRQPRPRNSSSAHTGHYDFLSLRCPIRDPSW